MCVYKFKNRLIDDCYEKVCFGKPEKPFHEIILQSGNKDDMGQRQGTIRNTGQGGNGVSHFYVKSIC
jgi:hypothetical protein